MEFGKFLFRCLANYCCKIRRLSRNSIVKSHSSAIRAQGLNISYFYYFFQNRLDFFKKLEIFSHRINKLLVMENFIEISRIVESALSGDKNRVIAYVKQLSSKLQKKGYADEATELNKYLHYNRNGTIGASSAAISKLPVDSESRLSLADYTYPSKGDVKLVLPDKVTQKIQDFLEYVRNSNKLILNGVGLTPNMLMYGPPGVGKTELAKYIASELELPLLTARMDALISSYLGSTAKNIRLLFDHANTFPCILFLDEFDAIAKLRDDQFELGELKRVVISLLQNIDTLSANNILLAATNHQHLLDSAIWRRFTYKVEIQLPETNERKSLIKIFLKNYASKKLDFDMLARVSNGLSGAALKQICEDVMRRVIISKQRTVRENDILKEMLLAKLPNDFIFDINNDKYLNMLHSEFKSVIPQFKMAELFSTSDATISRKINELKAKNE